MIRPWLLAAGVAALQCQSLLAQRRAGSDTMLSFVPGGRYALVLVVETRPPLTPEVASHLGELLDSTMITLRVDSLRGDSIFGIYGGEPRRIGAFVGGAARPRLFAARRMGRTFSIELSPDATDSGLLLSGRVTAQGGTGSWRVEQASTKGRFRVTRITDW